ncbi:MAG TPA: sulfite oxidase [Symbiobacteriaceae bacterium]|nr:sulfite oxidase [Symbiobacteriaceae bacterium]
MSEPIVHQAEPLNREWPLTERTGWLTPDSRFFDRNHFRFPEVRADAWQIVVEGAVDRPQKVELWELKRQVPTSQWVTLECSGNKRAFFEPPAEGDPWRGGAVGNAQWTGVPLRAVLIRAGVKPGATWVRFSGADAGRFKETGQWVHFERALPLAQALDAGVLLAYEMNGEPLPMAHGGPVRLVVPGWYGMASVKWVSRIEVRTEPFRGPFQVRDYVYLPAPGAYDQAVPVTVGRVSSVITAPADMAEVRPGTLLVTGLAWSGAAPVARVDVSLNGETWVPATLDEPVARYAWRGWHCSLPDVRPGKYLINARAADELGNVQPFKAPWNAKGYGNNQIAQANISVSMRPTQRLV